MKTLIVEDDFVSRLMLQKFIAPYGESHVAVDGREAVDAVRLALETKDPYDLICLDIMLPEMDGQAVLAEVRAIEQSYGIQLGDGAKIVMTTALSDMKNKLTAIREFCDAYLVKPIDRAKFLEQLRELHLID